MNDTQFIFEQTNFLSINTK